MVRAHFAIYLNDHLAGSYAAVELLKHLERTYPDTPMASFFVTLREEIVADRRQVEGLMDRLQIAASRPRKASVWIAGKFAELKLRLDDRARGPLRLLETLEAIALGIDGKLALWHALRASAAVNPSLQGMLDCERLEKRAEEQRQAVEILRLEAAKITFSTNLSSKLRRSLSDDGGENPLRLR